jgi:hypothetical protein
VLAGEFARASVADARVVVQAKSIPGPMKRERTAVVLGWVEGGRAATRRTDWVVGRVRLDGAVLLLLFVDRDGDEEELLVEREGGADDEGERDGGGWCGEVIVDIVSES